MVGDIFRNVTDRYMKKIRNTELQNGRLYLFCSDNQPAPLDRSGTSADALYGVHDGLYEGARSFWKCAAAISSISIIMSLYPKSTAMSAKAAPTNTATFSSISVGTRP